MFDPRPDPLAQRVAYVSGRLLCVGELDGRWRVLAGGDADEPETVTWGSADFVAAEEMDRYRGYWWSPDGTALAVARVDTAPVQRWHLADPADPAAAPAEVAYPAGRDGRTPTSRCTSSRLDGSIVDVEWDRAQYPYLADVHWRDGRADRHGAAPGPAARRGARTVSEATGATDLRLADTDDGVGRARRAACPGSPRTARSSTCADRDGARRLLVDGTPVTPPDLQVRAVATVDGSGVVFTRQPDRRRHVAARLATHGGRRAGGAHRRTGRPRRGRRRRHGRRAHRHARRAGRAVGRRLDGIELTVARRHAVVAGERRTCRSLGERRLATVVLLPHDHDGSPLPVLLDPYGGPHAGRAVRAHNAHLSSQWFADQGFAVVVADGRGTPGRGSAWERAVHLDLATAVLDDQVDGAPATPPRSTASLDLERVAIRGWSFGGYLAALAVLRRPDVFHAAIAGAPLTDWRLYDTHYTERYLGDPNEQPDVYDASSLLPLARAARHARCC